MKCAYCEKETKGTKEHIISKSVLDLFPECFLTIDRFRNVIHGNDPTIKDVCSECNNKKLNYIDTYAKSFIEKYFLERRNEELTIEYDYTLLQKVLLKYTFNDLRSKNMDVSFFDNEIIDYIKDKNDTEPKKYITILGGTAINNTPLPDPYWGNMKLQWIENPIFRETPIVKCLNYETGEIIFEKNQKIAHFDQLKISSLFRFHTGQFILLCWDKHISDDEIRVLNIRLAVDYPYTVLSTQGNDQLPICTDEMNYVHIEDIHLRYDSLYEIGLMRKYATDGYQERDKLIEAWIEEEKKLAEEHNRT